MRTSLSRPVLGGAVTSSNESALPQGQSFGGRRVVLCWPWLQSLYPQVLRGWPFIGSLTTLRPRLGSGQPMETDLELGVITDSQNQGLVEEVVASDAETGEVASSAETGGDSVAETGEVASGAERGGHPAVTSAAMLNSQLNGVLAMFTDVVKNLVSENELPRITMALSGTGCFTLITASYQGYGFISKKFLVGTFMVGLFLSYLGFAPHGISPKIAKFCKHAGILLTILGSLSWGSSIFFT